MLLSLLCFCSGIVRASAPSDDEPINYASAAVHEPIATLQKRIASGTLTLEYDDKHGYLTSLLKELNVSASSQMLVFSKTSFQRHYIFPESPRALYFSDDMYIGWVKGAEMLEIVAMDPEKGPIFYTLPQHRADKPEFTRQTDNCLQCHESGMTEGNPGLLVRSVFPDSDGMPIYSAGTFRISHESLLKERWGGWYVTGTHGAQRHMGNQIVKDKEHPDSFDADKGANVTDLSRLIDVRPYLNPGSDIVALMTLEHQAKAQNLITRASYLARAALRDEAIMDKVLNRPVTPGSPHSESTVSRIKDACEPLVKYMLFTDETKLTARVKGTSDFAAQFQAQGPRDHLGRSLRDYDLKTRLFRYPFSYLIYSEAFDALPTLVREYVLQRVYDILSGKDRSADYAKISAIDREAILEILRETKPNLPLYWKASGPKQ